jgi:hypothetical protein
MTGPLSEFIAAQHVKDLLDEAERAAATRSDSAAIDSDRPALAKSR